MLPCGRPLFRHGQRRTLRQSVPAGAAAHSPRGAQRSRQCRRNGALWCRPTSGDHSGPEMALGMMDLLTGHDRLREPMALRTSTERVGAARILAIAFIVFTLVSATAIPGVIPSSCLQIPISRFTCLLGVNPVTVSRGVLVGPLHGCPSLARWADRYAPRDFYGHRRRRLGWMRRPCLSRPTQPPSCSGCCPSSAGFPPTGATGCCRMSWPASRSGRSWCRRAWPMPASSACRRSWASTRSSRH